MTTVLVNLLVGLAVVVLVPLGLRLIDGPGLPTLAHWWPVAGLCAAVALWLPRGPVATALGGVYLLITLAAVAVATVRLWTTLVAPRTSRAASTLTREVAVGTALVTPSVGATSLVAERAGIEFLGFDLPILALTAPHLHYAGFAAALVAGLVHRASGDSVMGRVAALSVPSGTAAVLVGYFVDDWAELVGAVVLTVGMWAVGWVTLREIRPGVGDPWSRALLAVSAVVLAVTMLLALWWALGEATDLPHPTIGQMVATHGVANALGFGVCGVLAWRRLAAEPL